MAKIMSRKRISRRDFLKSAAAGTIGAAVVATLPAAKSFGKVSGKTGKKRLAMLIDLRRCNGCQTCAIACKAEFNVRLGAFRSWVQDSERGKYPNVRRTFLPRLCNHCKHSTCSLVCPTKATYEREDGVVMVDKEKCVGCRYCMNACPYGSRYFNWQKDNAKDKSRIFGTVDKCDFCVHRVDKGLVPSCVNACPEEARIFGDINDPDTKISRLIACEAVQTILPGKGTDPQVFYIGLDESTVKGGMKGGR